MDKPWLSQYPAGVPAKIDIQRFSSLADMLAASCARFADLPAYRSMGTAMSFGELDDASRAFAAWLQTATDLQRGDRVALMMPNLLQYPVAMFGILRAGMVVVNVNPLYTPRELEHQLKDSGARAIVVLENFAHTLEQVVGATQVRTVVTTQVGDLLPPLQRLLTNTVVKHVKKLVPAWQLQGAVSFRQRACRRDDRRRSMRSHSATTTWPFCSTPAAPRAWPRERCSATATWWPTCCRWRPGCRPT